jgi:hypothetical protein
VRRKGGDGTLAIVLTHFCIDDWSTGSLFVDVAALELFLRLANLSISLGSLGTGRDTSRPRLEAPVVICLWLIQNFHDLNRDRDSIRTGVTDGLPSRKSHESCADRSQN